MKLKKINAWIVALACFLPFTASKGAYYYARSAAGGGPAVAPGYVASGSDADAGATTSTVTMTVPAGANKIMLISVGQGNSGGTPKSITSVVWSGNGTPQNATAITGCATNDGNFCAITGYYLVNPTVETGGTLVTTFGTAPGVSAVLVTVYTNANQSPTFGTPVMQAQTSGTTSTVTVSTGTGQISWGATMNDANGAITIGGTSSPTSRLELEGVSGDMGTAAGDTTGSGTFLWSWAGADNGGVIAAFTVDGI